ncbi:MAG: hypothetical protein PHI67_09240 [Candidatus Methanomethylophilaceae archaeon]|nr:hypothetical protein [Candidatus Methanomethylophilaceae archaeon]
MGTAASQVKPGEKGDIEIPGDMVIAVRAVRRRENDILSAGQPIDADIKKAAYNAAENKKGNRPEMEGDSAPVFNIIHGMSRVRKVDKYVP